LGKGGLGGGGDQALYGPTCVFSRVGVHPLKSRDDSSAQGYYEGDDRHSDKNPEEHHVEKVVRAVAVRS
jgi:hypothetical protein